MGMPSGVSGTSLGSMIGRLPDLDDALTIYVAGDGPVTADSVVVLVDEENEDSPAGTRYLLEVSQARDVLRVWSSWRGGRVPDVTEACRAVSHYARHDAYQPVDPGDADRPAQDGWSP